MLPAVVFLCHLRSIPTVPGALHVRDCACFSLDLGSESRVPWVTPPGDRVHLSVLFPHHNIHALREKTVATKSCFSCRVLFYGFIFTTCVCPASEHVTKGGRACQEGGGRCHLHEETRGWQMDAIVDEVFSPRELAGFVGLGTRDRGGLRTLLGGGLFELEPGRWRGFGDDQPRWHEPIPDKTDEEET